MFVPEVAVRAVVLGVLMVVPLACSKGQVGGTNPDAAADATADATTTDATAPNDVTGDQVACALTCAGCCLENQCLPGGTDKACGSGGAECRDCTLNGQTCDNATCVGTCTPYCGDKCLGQDDGCGDPCPVNTCTGCCDSSPICRSGTGNAACGTGGEACVDCTQSSLTCVSDGTCQCVPDCTDKCQGEDDGCGGPCPSNTCSGCCNSAGTCQNGTTATVCGTGGVACVDCTPAGEVCVSGTCQCVPDCNGKCVGADDGCGTPCATNHCPGCCDATNACLDGKLDTACGKKGVACVDCTLTSTTCKAGSGSCM